MRVGDIRALRGPNVYSHRPVLSMKLYLDALAGKESREFPGFTATGEFRFMVGNQNNQRKANNDRHNSAAQKAAKNNGRGKSMIIGRRFSERGRIRRLLGAVAQSPRMLGIGIDEDTAVVVESDGTFHAAGSGAVYVVDGHDLSHTNISEVSFNRAMSVFGVKLHVLSSGDRFDMRSRHPAHARARVEDLDAELRLIREEIA